VAQLLEQQGTTLAGLRHLLVGSATEKTRDVLARAGVASDAPSAPGGEASGDRVLSASLRSAQPAVV
jgi:hypothetical protein